MEIVVGVVVGHVRVRLHVRPKRPALPTQSAGPIQLGQEFHVGQRIPEHVAVSAADVAGIQGGPQVRLQQEEHRLRPRRPCRVTEERKHIEQRPVDALELAGKEPEHDLDVVVGVLARSTIPLKASICRPSEDPNTAKTEGNSPLAQSSGMGSTFIEAASGPAVITAPVAPPVRKARGVGRNCTARGQGLRPTLFRADVSYARRPPSYNGQRARVAELADAHG